MFDKHIINALNENILRHNIRLIVECNLIYEKNIIIKTKICNQNNWSLNKTKC